MTDAPCGEHGAGTGFVLYVALSRGGELLAVSGTESPLQSQLGPDRGVRWCGHGLETSLMKTALAAKSVRRLL